MANRIPLAYADVELQLSTSISVGATSFSVASANDDDGNALPAGKYCFTIDSGTSAKEYLIGQLNGTAVTSVYSVSRQGVESSGAARAHRIGAPATLTDFATIQRVADILRGQVDLDGSNPVGYDAEPTLADRKDLATVGYVLDTVSGGTVAFDSQVISSANGGEAIVAGNLVYFKTSDQEWYKTDADTAATVDGVQLGIALGTGSDGVAITGGVQTSGTYTTSGLTAGSLYYASNTAGAISSSAGTTSRVIGLALSTTKLLLIPVNPQSQTSANVAALAGGGNFGTPSSTNKFLTETYNASATGLPVVRTYLNAGSPATWTKPAGLKYIVVEVQAGGGGGAGGTSGSSTAGGGGSGAYTRKLIPAASLGATETVTTGAAGAAGGNNANGGTGGDSSFGAHLVCTGGGGGTTGGSGGSGGSVTTAGDFSFAGISGSVASSSGMGTDGRYFPPAASSYMSKGGRGSVSGFTDTVVTGQMDTGYGGGGVTAVGDSVGATWGGSAGLAGIVLVTEYYS